jgi:hypothetical protein
MAAKDTGKPKRYGHPVYRFSILPPQGWQVVEPGPGGAVVMFVGPPRNGPPPQMSIEVHDAKGLTLKEYDKTSKERAKKNLKEYVLLSERDRRIGALKGHEVKIGFRRGSLLVGALIFYAINRSRLYVVTCMSALGQFGAYAATFDKTLNSLKVW